MKLNSKLSKNKIYYLIVENLESNTFSIKAIYITKQIKRRIYFIYHDKTRQGFCDITDIYEDLETAFKNYIYTIYTDSGIEYTREAKRELFHNIKKYYQDSQIQFELLFKDFLEKEALITDFFTMKKNNNE